MLVDEVEVPVEVPVPPAAGSPASGSCPKPAARGLLSTPPLNAGKGSRSFSMRFASAARRWAGRLTTPFEATTAMGDNRTKSVIATKSVGKSGLLANMARRANANQTVVFLFV